MNDNELAFVTTEDIIQELRRRLDTAAFICRTDKAVNGKGDRVIHFWSGDEHTVAGMCEQLKLDALASLTDAMEEIDPEEPKF